VWNGKFGSVVGSTDDWSGRVGGFWRLAVAGLAGDISCERKWGHGTAQRWSVRLIDGCSVVGHKVQVGREQQRLPGLSSAGILVQGGSEMIGRSAAVGRLFCDTLGKLVRSACRRGATGSQQVSHDNHS